MLALRSPACASATKPICLAHSRRADGLRDEVVVDLHASVVQEDREHWPMARGVA
jgi:hypothetical protein